MFENMMNVHTINPLAEDVKSKNFMWTILTSLSKSVVLLSTECTNGYYRLNCLKACSKHFWVAQRCHRITGECQGGCHTGWRKPTCEASKTTQVFA